MAGFAMILGGAMSGWSDAKLDEIKAQREERMKELEAQRQDRRLAEDREFRSREAELGRQHDTSMEDRREKFQGGQNDLSRSADRENREDTQTFTGGENEKTRAADKAAREEDNAFRIADRAITQENTSTENEKDRDWRSVEAQKAREASGDVVTGEGGTSYSRVGSKATPITDDKGKPIKLTGSVKDKPAEVSTAEWLIQQGVASDAATAWKMVRSARNDPDKSRASIYKAWLDALTKGAMGTPDPAELEKQAREATEKTLTYLNEDDSGADGGANPGSGAGDAIPSDPAKRTVGKIYKSPNGKIAKWTGQGWELVE